MKKKVKEEKTELTRNEEDLLQKIDYADTFSTTNHTNNIREITNLIFNTTPAWVNSLFTIRNKVVSIFGLETKVPDDYNDNFEIGGYVKFFKIFAISDNEITLGADDSHLNFRAVIKNDKSELFNVKVITLVQYNNYKGNIYMGFIKPVHKQIVKRMVRNAYCDN